MAVKKDKKEPISSRLSVVTGMRLIMFFLILVLSVSFLFSVFWIVQRERKNSAVREAENTIRSLEDSLSAEIKRNKELSRLVMIDGEVVRFLRSPSDEIEIGMIDNTRYSILAILNVTTLVDSVFIFRNDGQFLNTSRDRYSLNFDRMGEESWQVPILKEKGGAIVMVNADGVIFKVKGRPLVTIGRVIYDISTQQKTGMLFMNVSASLLDGKIDAITNGRLAIFGKDMTYISGDTTLKNYVDPAECTTSTDYKIITDAKKRYVLTYKLASDMPMILACAVEIGNGFVMYETIYVLLMLILIFGASIAIAGGYISKNITTPIYELTTALEHSREAGRLENIDLKIPDNEVGLLKDSYNGMVERVNVLYEKDIENEQVIRRAEMRVLQEQIKPHFLYNSLETIGYMAMDAGAENVYSALETLGSFYRNFLSKGDREIPFGREINIVKDYLSLQKLRYGDIIEDEYDIGEGTEECIIPKLILQPIVENSIYHGIRMKGEGGVIAIRSRIEGNFLHIYIKDTGIGMSREKIDAILNPERPVEPDDGPGSESFGLWGTVERIRYWSGMTDVVKIRSELGEYTEIEFIIPEKREVK
ncbi:MAG: sensor histidine kinase [Lachnospiraceae bacterium]|nr:sensor histidine kinase [Lachnospiraceae bacterium]